MAENQNTVYLSTPTTGEVVRSSIASTVFSDVSLSGTADLSTTQITGAATFDSTIAQSDGQGSISVVSTSLQSIAALTVNDYESNQTTFTDNWAALGDVVIATPLDSDLSNGLAYNAYVSAASTVCLRFSNCSGTEAKPVAQTWRFTLLRF